MPDLKEQLRIARVNRMKSRAAKAWHAAHCERCMHPFDFILKTLNEKAAAGEVVEVMAREPISTAH